MNSRIKELANKCYETGPLGRDGWPEYSRINPEKFAELIVRECMEVCADRGTHHDGLYSAWADDCSKRIGKHFGVES